MLNYNYVEVLTFAGLARVSIPSYPHTEEHDDTSQRETHSRSQGLRWKTNASFPSHIFQALSKYVWHNLYHVQIKMHGQNAQSSVASPKCHNGQGLCMAQCSELRYHCNMDKPNGHDPVSTIKPIPGVTKSIGMHMDFPWESHGVWGLGLRFTV